MPIQETITANVGGATAAIDQVSQRMTKLEQATRRANAAARDQQRILSQQAQGRRGFMGSVGGAIGGAGSRVASSINMGGGFAALSVGAIAVGVAFRQLGSVIQRRIEDERQAIQIGHQLRKIQQQGMDARKASGTRGLSDQDVVRTLVARGGRESEAESVSKDLNISFRDAASGLAELRLLPAHMRNAAQYAAESAHVSGLSTFGESIAAMRSNPLAMRDVYQNSYTKQGTALLLSRMLGNDVDPNELGRASARVGNNPLLKAGRATQDVNNKIQEKERALAVEGFAEAGAREELSRIANPEAAALAAMHREITDTVDGLKQMNSALHPLVKTLLLFTTTGGPGVEALRMQRVTGTAMGSDNQPPLGSR